VVIEHSSFSACYDVKDLGCPIAAGGEVFTIGGKPDADYDAVMLEGMDQGDI
jgi:hypothetical protein